MRRLFRLRQWLWDRWLEVLLLLLLGGVVWWIGSSAYSFVPHIAPTPTPQTASEMFSGASALKFAAEQAALGPRPTGSEANIRTGDYILEELKAFGWETEVQSFTYRGVAGRNIIGRAGKGPLLIVGAHYDTRPKADRDPEPDRRTQPIIGANDGASGVAVLLELARTLDKSRLRNKVQLAFFDAEDRGGLDGWPFSVGAQYMADHLEVAPEAAIVIDMIGDADQQIYQEQNSTPELRERIWSVAAEMGYADYFIPVAKWPITDDHMPFLQHGYKAVDIIDFDYPYWHTMQDTLDKLSAASLERVGRVLETLLESNGEEPTPQQ